MQRSPNPMLRNNLQVNIDYMSHVDKPYHIFWLILDRQAGSGRMQLGRQTDTHYQYIFCDFQNLIPSQIRPKSVIPFIESVVKNGNLFCRWHQQSVVNTVDEGFTEKYTILKVLFQFNSSTKPHNLHLIPRVGLDAAKYPPPLPFEWV